MNNPKLQSLLALLGGPQAAKKPKQIKPNLPKKPILQRPSTVGGW